MLPIAPRYQHLIRELAFLPASPCMPPDVRDFLNITRSLLAKVPGAYFGFAKHSGQVGAVTYCKICEFVEAGNPNAADCKNDLGEFTPGYLAEPRQERLFFAGWTPAARPAWAEGLAEPARAIECPTRKLAELKPVTDALAYWNPSIRQKMLKEAVQAGQLDQGTCAATASGSWFVPLDQESAGSDGLHSAV